MEVISIILGCIMLVSESITAFIGDMSQSREVLTVKTYRSRLSSLNKRLGDREVSSLTADDLQQWLTSQRTFADGRDKAPDTIRLTMTASDLWQLWLVEKNLVPAVVLPKQRKPMGRQREIIPEPEETREIFEHVGEDFRLALRVLRLTGCRPNELCRMQISDYDRHLGLIVLAKHKTVKKTGKPRLIPVGHPTLVELIDQAIGERKAGHIFRRASGRPWTTEALSGRYRRARKLAELPKDLVLYCSRHEHATQLYEATQDLNAVAAALGHTNILMASRYAKVRPAMLKKNQNHFSEGLG